MALVKAIQSGSKFKFEEDGEIFTFLFLRFNVKNECIVFYSDSDDKAQSRKIDSLFNLIRI